jgi:hypothetical protein
MQTRTSSPSSRVLLIACFAALALPGCRDENGEPPIEIANRLTSVDAYRVRFEPSRGDLTPAARSAEADAWRSQVRTIAGQVAQTVSDANVYGDQELWQPIIEGSSSRVQGCEYSNDSARYLSVTPGQGDQIRAAAVAAALLTGTSLTGSSACDLGARDLRSFNISAARFTAGIPTASLETLEVIVESGDSPTPWTELDFATLSVTHDPSIGRGAAQFAFLVVEKEDRWQDNFEEVFLVTRGSYFGDLR